MKRLLFGISVLICLALIAVYIFIPAEIKLSKSIFIKTQAPAASRFLLDKRQWAKWFPSDAVTPDATSANTILRSDNFSYTVGNALMNTTQVLISDNKRSINSLINTLSINKDSAAVEWKAEIKTSMNPIGRIRSYNDAKEIESDMNKILTSLQAFLEKQQNVYGLKIVEQQVTDTILISTKYFSSSTPSTIEIYSLLNNLQKYISKEGGKETNPPMLNIAKDGNTYRTMVAIPVDKTIPEKDNYVFKRMVPGRILVAEVRGGEYRIQQAFKQLGLYVDDNHLSSPAIPFASLITNRQAEPDTTKWITKIYYPIY